MTTSFNVFSLGTAPIIDSTEGNTVSENAGALVGTTFGGFGSELYNNIAAFTPGTVGASEGDAGAYDTNNSTANDTFRINGGADQTFTAAAVYSATLTYADGTTATISATVFQDAAGNTYLAPSVSDDADMANLEAKAIRSLTLDSVIDNDTNMPADRQAGNFAQPDGTIDGTSGDDTITPGFVDSDGDSIDGADGNDDVIIAGDGNDTVFANAGNDTVFGGTGNDLIYGGDGNDSVDGGDGDDAIDGGAGDDTLDTGTGSDFAYGGTGNDTITASGLNYSVFGGDGDDNLILGGTINSNNIAQGDDGDDTLTGSNGLQNLFGGTGNDTIYGGDDSTTFDVDVLDGGDGDDLIVSGAFGVAFDASFQDNGDIMTGGAGNDTLIGGAADDQMYGGADNDTIDGGSGADTIEGGTGNNTLYGGDGDDTLNMGLGGENLAYGGTGDDTIAASGRNFTVFGGDGDDTITTTEFGYASSNSAVYGEDGNDTLNGANGMQNLYGGAGNDTIYGGNDINTFDVDTLDGGDGDDVIISGASGTAAYAAFQANGDVMTGGAGNDTLIGGSADDQIFGGADNDSIEGGTGADTIDGGTGDDNIDGGDGADTFVVNDGFGNDTISGGEGGTDFDTIDLSGLTVPVTVTYTGDEAGTITDGTNTITFTNIEKLILTDLADFVDASADTVGVQIDALGGDDNIEGGSGADLIDAGHGNDFVNYAIGGDTVFGGAGDDNIHGGSNPGIDDAELYGGDGNDTIVTYGADDSIYGGAGNDTISADNGDEYIDGGADDDLIYASSGNDTIDGGTGDDTIYGGDGDDTFVYNAGDGHDTITDFNSGNTSALGDGNTDNNDFINLSAFYDNISELRADYADDNTLNQSNTDVDYTNNASFGAGSLQFNGASPDATSFSADNTGVVCFTSGTAIRTPRGPVLIDDLRVGDVVETADNGPQPIRWIGTRTLDQTTLMTTPKLRPILIKKGIIGNTRQLLVSPQHGMMIGQDTLVRAKHLVGKLDGVRVAHGKKSVCYVHLMFDAHQIIFAENAKSESFYPGPMALKMMQHDALIELFSIFPELQTKGHCRTQIFECYGDLARPFAPKKKLAQMLVA